MKLNDMISKRRDWTCPRDCGEQYWAHQLYGDYDFETGEGTLTCPPPPEPKDCCGRMPGKETEEIRTCSNGQCQAWWCVCGVFTGTSAGPVSCNCEYDRGEVPTTSDDVAAVADDDLPTGVTVVPAEQFDALSRTLDVADSAPNLGQLGDKRSS